MMWQVVGHDRTVSFLQRSLEKGALSHAYLLVGPPHVGKMTLALNLAQALNCEAAEPPCFDCEPCQKIASGKHADVQVLGLTSVGDSTESRSRVEISIDQIREMQHAANLPPFEGRYKVFIIDGAECLSIEAANSLLKTLEEPAERVVFILLTTSESLLPATVVSRCQRLELRPLGTREVEGALNSCLGIETEKARLLAGICRGRLGWAIMAAEDDTLLQQRSERLDKLLEVVDASYNGRFAYAAQLASQFGQNRRPVQEVLDLWLDWWRDLLMVKAGCKDAITNIDLESVIVSRAESYSLAEIKTVIDSIKTAAEQLEQNANPQLVLEVLMLNIARKGDAVKKASLL